MTINAQQETFTGQFNGDRIIFLTNGSETTGYPHAKGWIWNLTSHHTQKVTWNISDQNVWAKNIKLLSENMVANFVDFGLGNYFLNTLNTWGREKANKLDFIKMQNLCT